MAEQHSRKRRIVRRVVLALAAVVLWLVAYIGSYCACGWCINHQRGEEVYWATPAFAPCERYIASALPGSAELEAMYIWVSQPGSVPLRDVYTLAQQRREYRKQGGLRL